MLQELNAHQTPSPEAHRVAEGLPCADWYVGQSPPLIGAQYKAIDRCKNLGFDAWLPQVVTTKFTRNSSGRGSYKGGKRETEEVTRPLFGTYWFVSFAVDNPQWGKILHDDRCVARLLCRKSDAGYHPYRLPHGFVEILQSLGREKDGALPSGIEAGLKSHDWGEVGATLTAPGETPRLPQYTPGRITDGPFASFAATVRLDMGDRILVMAEIFGRLSQVELRREDFEVVK